jgi:hypothetical protein
MVRGCIDAMALAILLATAAGAAAQVPPSVPMQTPSPNPSSSLVLPQAPEVPVSPGPGPGAAATVTGVPSGDPYYSSRGRGELYGDTHYSGPRHAVAKRTGVAYHHRYRHHHS